MSDRNARTIGIVLGSLLLLCLCCLAVMAGGAFAFQNWISTSDIFSEYGDIYQPSDPTPTAQPLQDWQTTADDIDLAEQTLQTLEDALVPENDPAELAVRLGGVDSVPELALDPDAPYQVGAVKDFWVTNTSTNISSQKTAVLRYVTDHAYFWIGEDVSYSEAELRDLAEAFESRIYPTTREYTSETVILYMQIRGMPMQSA